MIVSTEKIPVERCSCKSQIATYHHRHIRTERKQIMPVHFNLLHQTLQLFALNLESATTKTDPLRYAVDFAQV